MNIGLVIISVPGGGSETVVYNLQNYLSKKRHRVTLIANEEFFAWDPPITCDKINLKCLLDPNFMIKRIFGKRLLPKIVLKKKAFIIPILLDVYFRKEIKHIIREINYKKIDVLHFHDPYGLKLYKPLSKISNIPSVYTFHGNDIGLPFYTRGLKKTFIKTINRIDSITTVSNYMKNCLISQGIKKEIKVIYNGIDLDRLNSIKQQLNKDKKENNEGVDKDKFSLLFPGGEKIWKGGKELLEAILFIRNQMPNLRLYITREVSKNHIYREFTRRYNLEKNVSFLGLLSIKRYYEYLNLVDCLIMPSEKEPFGIVFLDAMAMGKPIIASNNGGVVEVIDDQVNGLLCNRKPRDISEKIISLYKNPKLREKMSKNNLEKVKKFDWNKITDQYIDLYEAIAK